MRDDFSKTSWYGLFRNDLINARVIVLIGVSFDYDNELQKMLAENPEYNKKIIFIDKKEIKDINLSIQENPMYKYKKRKFGKVYEISVDGFSNKIEEIKKTYKAKSQIFEFQAFKNINAIEYNVNNLDGQDYWSLLVYGHIKDELVYNNVLNNKYIINRNQLKRIKELLVSDEIQAVIIHSDLGNGKTCSTMMLSHMLKDEGEVFFLNQEVGDINKEIEMISEIRGKKFIIIENYGNYLNVLSKFKTYIDKDIKFILTERSFVHDSIYYSLIHKLDINDRNIIEYDLNKIEEEDLDNLIYILDKVDKWEDRHISSEEKKKEIRKIYKSSFREILIKLINSQSVSEKLKKIYNSIQENRIKKNVLLAVCINSILRTELTLSDIIALLNIKIPNHIRRDKNINEILSFDSNIIYAKSSILASHIIKNNGLSFDALSVMKEMAIRANELKYGEKIQEVTKDFVSSSNVWLVLGEKNKSICKYLLSYYDELKDYKGYKENPFFYLQYAMACLDMKYYDRAGEYLTIAYKESEKLNNEYKRKGKSYRFDTFQIDTQNGRYLLEKAIESQEESMAIDVFKKVHNIFITTLSKEKTQEQLVYKQVINYKPFFEVYKWQFSYEDKKEFLEATKIMKDYIEKYIEKRSTLDMRNAYLSLTDLETDIIKSMVCSEFM